MIAEAQSELLDRVVPALDEFAKTAPEIAVLIRTLLDELADPRIHGFGISEDGIHTLHTSSGALANLEDNAGMLLDAAESLVNLPDWITALKRAASEARSAASALEDARSS
ncbi:hypothetical protein ABZ826_38425 [Streptomyces sp. NPDC047515]|uniref:hypothetical protein n=1 Tax=Streptomyces sp. NPDC047515 TaxID=3155380 RepID=UPI00340843C4